MFTSGGKRRHDDQPGRVPPSSSPRNRLRIPNAFFKRGWIIAAVLTAVTVVVTARGTEDFGAAATSETVPAPHGDEGSVVWQGARKTGVSADKNDGNTRLSADEEGDRRRRLDGLEPTDQCEMSSLWGNKVDAANYEFGCKEIEEMLHGPKDLVGHGRVRDVYFVEYKERTVVVKTLREVDNLTREKAHFVMHRREVLALDAVRGHPNIVGMLGVCNTTLVTEYHSTHFGDAIFRDKTPFSIVKTVTMALDAARGLQALHEASTAPIVHLDMKPQQLLIDEHGRVKVNDLNSARFMGTSPSGRFCPFSSNVSKRVVAWRAPENIAGKVLSEKVDIYSMGMIFYSLMARALPYPHEERAVRKSFRGERPAIDPSWHEGYMQVVQDMWQGEPTLRPSAGRVVERLEGILDSLNSNC